MKDRNSLRNAAGLSPLENDVLNLIWKRSGGMRAREVHAKLRKKAAPTSVAVILKRLCSKGALVRKSETGRGGTHYIYSAVPKESFQKSQIAGAVDRLVASFGSVAVNYFNEKYGKRKK